MTEKTSYVDKIYDDLLTLINLRLENDFVYWPYKTHPEYLPFIGDQYTLQNNKVLLVLESHYLELKDSNNLLNKHNVQVKSDKEINKNFCDCWYDETKWLLNNESFKIESSSYFNTRFVANSAIKGDKFNNRVLLEPIYQYNLVHNICKDGYTSNTNRKKLRDFAYQNFFQRPSLKTGLHITQEYRDIEVASKNLVEVIKIIKPNNIIFISANSYDIFLNFIKNYNIQFDNSKIQIYRFRQPGTRCWSSRTKSEILSNSKCNRDRLQDLFRNLV